MKENTVVSGVFVVGVGIGFLLCQVLQDSSRRRREREQTRRQFQLEIESLRRDLDALHRDAKQLLQKRDTAPSPL
jgi:uncharacterized membrane-anchored protein YhcB (DUF1043 family)